MTMMTTSPRLRADLQALPVEDADGVLYYDVSDPKTGTVLRLFDFEWLLAQRLDGRKSLDELVSFTEAELGFSTSRADLEVYAEKLQQLGLIDLTAPLRRSSGRSPWRLLCPSRRPAPSSACRLRSPAVSKPRSAARPSRRPAMPTPTTVSWGGR
jgi:hypothetical protein